MQALVKYGTDTFGSAYYYFYTSSSTLFGRSSDDLLVVSTPIAHAAGETDMDSNKTGDQHVLFIGTNTTSTSGSIFPTSPASRMIVGHPAYDNDEMRALGHEGYRKRYGIDNPNYDMIQSLEAFGVQVVLCGQTQMSRGLGRQELAPNVQVALSAMTALVTLQSQGYNLISF